MDESTRCFELAHILAQAPAELAKTDAIPLARIGLLHFVLKLENVTYSMALMERANGKTFPVLKMHPIHLVHGSCLCGDDARFRKYQTLARVLRASEDIDAKMVLHIDDQLSVILKNTAKHGICCDRCCARYNCHFNRYRCPCAPSSVAGRRNGPKKKKTKKGGDARSGEMEVLAKHWDRLSMDSKAAVCDDAFPFASYLRQIGENVSAVGMKLIDVVLQGGAGGSFMHGEQMAALLDAALEGTVAGADADEALLATDAFSSEDYVAVIAQRVKNTLKMYGSDQIAVDLFCQS